MHEDFAKFIIKWQNNQHFFSYFPACEIEKQIICNYVEIFAAF